MKVYGTMICVDCREYQKVKNEMSLPWTFVDLTADTKKLKEFLQLRESHPAFAPVLEKGGIGIPCFVDNDFVTFDLSEALAHEGLSLPKEKQTALPIDAVHHCPADPETVLNELLKTVRKADAEACAKAKKRWDSIAKPLNSLGAMEDTVIRIAGMTEDGHVRLKKKALVAMCADNGVVAEGVSQTGTEITAIVANQFANGRTPTTMMCDMTGTDVFAVDLGILKPICEESAEESVKPRTLIDRCLMRGTGNIAKGPAMSRKEAVQALLTGIEMVGRLKNDGYDLIVTGEMGIANTTTSSAMTAVLLNQDIDLVTGRGAGLSNTGLIRKCDAIRRAIEVNSPNPEDAIDVLSKVGGLDIAGMAGLFLGGGIYHMPIVADGFISTVAAVTAIRICENVRDYIITSHTSKEPAGRMLLEAIGVPAILDAHMSLGEGSGGVAALPYFEMAAEIYNQMGTFGDIDMEAYTPQN